MSGSINDNAYQGAQVQGKVFAKLDETAKDQNVTKEEASSKLSDSVFTNAQDKSNEAINEKIAKSRLAGKNNALATVQKYLGATNIFSNLSFKTINYTAQEIDDEGWRASVQSELDGKIDQEIQSQINSAQNIVSQYESKIEQAIKRAENELCGDEDAQNDAGQTKGKESNKNSFYYTLNGLRFNKDAGEAAFYEGSTGTAAGTSKGSQGYQTTVAYLKANGAKEFTREVDGKQQTIYKLSGGEHVVVDDAGQVHTLKTTTTLGKNTYMTEEAYDALGVQDGEKVKRRKVDGGYQTVVMSSDKKTARVVDYNDQTGGYVVTDNLRHVSAGGRAKFTSETSGLTAAVNQYTNDDLKFVDKGRGKVEGHTWSDLMGNVYSTDQTVTLSEQKAREANENINLAVKNLYNANKAKFTEEPTMVNHTYTANLVNGHTYQIDRNDLVNADRTLRMMRADIDSITVPPQNQTPETTEIDYTWGGDTRTDANVPGDAHDGGHGHTNGVRRGVTRAENGTYTGRSDNGHVHSLRGHLSSEQGLTAQQFRSEGWKTDANRTYEQSIISKMDNNAEQGGKIPTRLLRTATEFAERFVIAYQQQHNVDLGNINFEKLGKAIAAANPSLFDGDGNMYKNVDFQRLNLPKRLNPKNYT